MPAPWRGSYSASFFIACRRVFSERRSATSLARADLLCGYRATSSERKALVCFFRGVKVDPPTATCALLTAGAERKMGAINESLPSGTVLVVGSGGREHALAWKLAQSPKVDRVFVAPGNGGTAKDGKIENAAVSDSDFAGIAKFAKDNQVRLVVVGPEQPLVDGLVDYLKKEGIPAFGPSKRAAQLEASKAFSKDFMQKHHIPTAAYKNFTKYEDAVAYVRSVPHNVVIKASGLAAGKGVLIPQTQDEAVDCLKEIMVDRVFGSAGDEVVVEEFMTGPEISVFALSDGYSTVLLPAAQDHKKIGEGDTGLNTGGMGAYVPTPFSTPELMKTIETTVVRPTLDGMRRAGAPFVGCLFVGLMLTPNGPRVLEYNVRFGDPETEAVMMMLDDSTDLLDVLEACVEGRLDSVAVGVRDGFAVTVIAVSEGYPGSYPKGRPISLGSVKDAKVFHAGTKVQDGDLVTSGGRVMASTATAPSLRAALDRAYEALTSVAFEGMYYRRDIGHLALAHTKKAAQGVTYDQAGVSIDQGNTLVERIKPYTRATRRAGCDGELGGFGALFDMKAAGYEDPIIVSATDGVGTKLRIAQEMGRHATIGQDLVAMCVNDLIVQGAEPLFFLDYYACGKLDVTAAADVVKGIADGCVLAGCGLVGGETAEMPGMYQPGDYDLAGFAVGATTRTRILPTNDIKAGDVLIGLPSSGVHSNGYSLVRYLVKMANMAFHDPCPFAANGASSLGEALLTPTRIYVKALMPLVKAHKLKGLVHITGGGFQDNIPRVLPNDLAAAVDVSAWPKPAVFQWLRTTGNVEHHEMLRTFNCGIGMVLVVDSSRSDDVMAELQAAGEQCYVIGQLKQRAGEAVELSNETTGW